jgi:hypothetical protein
VEHDSRIAFGQPGIDERNRRLSGGSIAHATLAASVSTT